MGAGGQINWPVPEFVRLEVMEMRPLPQGRLMVVGAGLAGGDAFAWVKHTAKSWLSAFGVAIPGDDIYRVLCAAADDVPPECDGLTCEPLFRGTRRRPAARGTFAGVTFDNFTPGHIARAVLQGIARGFLSFYDGAGASRPEHLPRIIGSGNAFRSNPLLVEIISSTFGRDVWLPLHREEAACGAALLAGSTTGLWPDLETAGSRIHLAPAGAD